VSRVIPEMTQVALRTHSQESSAEKRTVARQKFLYRLSRSDYESEWGKDYQRPGVGTRVLAALLRAVPKRGPFKGLAFRPPTPQTEDLYIRSVNTTVEQYQIALEELRSNRAVSLPNYDLDTGSPTKPAEYPLADSSYAKLLDQLSRNNFNRTTPELRANILAFYSSWPALVDSPNGTARHQTLLALRDLKSADLATSPGSASSLQ